MSVFITIYKLTRFSLLRKVSLGIDFLEFGGKVNEFVNVL